jgi:hypothetical protein
MPVVVATWKAIGRIFIPGRLSSKVRKPHLNRRNLGVVALNCHPWCSRKHTIYRKIMSKPAWQKAIPYLQNNQRKKGLEV